MAQTQRSAGFERSAARFRAFFEELREVFVERDDILDQIALGLLGREHVLLTGPPGTAKSQLTRAVLGRIIDANTGEPSLYARQFTESTVVTDLVGAIDFKTLMATGRSEHFTDEGLLGSVHAFLDEVFDGRDMLLRSTLNLLGERELKQGQRTTRGRVECAIMTTNRYLAEVLLESHDSLLAFVDRIAFVGFVPKGFAHEESLRKVMRQVGGRGSPGLRAHLTVQDLDILQAEVDSIVIPETACDRLVSFLQIFEREMAASVRSIPDFVPSRYLSVRTKVRAAKALRSIVVQHMIYREPSRSPEVTLEDFGGLRLALLLSGPPPELIQRLVDEQDPREARQLKIVQKERDVFERSLSQLDKTPWRDQDPKFTMALPADLGRKSLDQLLELLSKWPSPHAAESLRQAILSQVIREGFDAQSGDPTSLERLAQVAVQVEGFLGPTEPLLRWLRAQSLSLLENLVERTACRVESLGEDSRTRRLAATLELLGPAILGLSACVLEAERLAQSVPRLSLERFSQQLALVAGAAVNRLNEALHCEVRATFPEAEGEASGEQVSARLSQLGRTLQSLSAFVATAADLHPAFSALGAEVQTSLLHPVLARVLRPLAEQARVDFLPTFDQLWDGLATAGLTRFLPVEQVLLTALGYAVEQDDRALLALAQPSSRELSPKGYQLLRQQLPRLPLCYIAGQLLLRVDPDAILQFSQTPEPSVLSTRLLMLPEPFRCALGQSDIRRIYLRLEFFEGWLDAATSPTAEAHDLFLLLQVLEQEEVWSRLRLETLLVQGVLPHTQPECQQLQTRAEELWRRGTAAVTARSLPRTSTSD